MLWLIWLRVHSFDSSDAPVVFHASSSSFHSCSSSSHWAPSYVICLILWLGSSPPTSHQVVADSMECPLASTQSLCHVRIKSSLEVLNHQHSSKLCLLGFWGHPMTLPQDLSSVIQCTSFYLAAWTQRGRKQDIDGGHSTPVSCLLSFPPFLFSRDQMRGFFC